MSNSRSQINSNFYQIANTDPTCGNVTGVNVGNVWATGNVTAAYFFGNGSQLTGLPDTYSNANVANFLPTYTGNVGTGAGYIFGNGAFLTGIQASNIIGGYSNANVANFLPTYTGNLAQSSDIQTLYANAATQSNAIANLQAAQYSNANVANYLQVLTSNVTTTANIQAAYFIGNGSQLTGLPEAYSNANVAAYLSSSPNLNISVNGTVTASVFYGDVIGNIQGNLTVAGANTGVLFKDSGNANAVTGFTFDKITNTATIGSNLTVGNVNSQYLYGNIRGTTGGYDDANVAVYLPTYLGNLQSGNLLVVNSAVIQGNLTVLGNTTTINANTLNISDKDITVANGATTASQANGAGLIVGAGNLANIIFNNPANAWTLYPGVDTPGNISGSYILGNITQATGYIVYGNANVAAYLPTYTGNLSNSSDIIALYANAATQANAIINIDSNIANLYANAASQSNAIANLQASAYSNANVANYLQVLTSNVTTTANIQAAYFIGNGSQLTGLPASYSNANVAAYLPVYGGNILGNNITGNILAVSLLPAYANGQLANNDVSIGNATHYFSDIYARSIIVPPSNTNNGFEMLVSSTPGQSGVTFIDPITGNATDIAAANGYFNNLDLTGSVTADSYIEGSELIALGNITAGLNANVVGNLVAGNISNVNAMVANFYYGNGYYLSGIQASNIVGAYGNANVSNFLANGFGSNTITTTGNIQAGTVKGTNFQATTSAGGTLKNSSGTTQASWGAGGGDNFSVAVSTNLDGANAQIDISPTGTGHVHIKPTGTGAVEIAPTNIGSINNMVIGNVTPAAANVTTLGATGNVTAAYYFGNGYFLTGIQASNIIGAYGNANVSNFLANGFGSNTITTTGNITAGYFEGNGYYLSGIQASNIVGAYGNANVANYLPTYTGNLAASSDIIALYANAATQSNAISNLQAAQYSNANVTDYLASNSNIVITTTGNITTTANLNTNSIIGIPNTNTIITTNGYNWTFDITGNLVLPANVLAINFANGTQIPFGGSYSNANVANYLQVLSSNVTTTANVQANYFIGNGSQLTGIATTATESFNPFLLAGM